MARADRADWRDRSDELLAAQGRGPVPKGPTLRDILESLRSRFGDRYAQSYEHGKHEFRDALAERFGLEQHEAERLVEELEQAQVIRFHREPADLEAAGPRLGLFGEPGETAARRPATELAGRYWELGRHTELPKIGGNP